MTVQGPAKEKQPDGMSHRGGYVLLCVAFQCLVGQLDCHNDAHQGRTLASPPAPLSSAHPPTHFCKILFPGKTYCWSFNAILFGGGRGQVQEYPNTAPHCLPGGHGSGFYTSSSVRQGDGCNGSRAAHSSSGGRQPVCPVHIFLQSFSTVHNFVPRFLGRAAAGLCADCWAYGRHEDGGCLDGRCR